MSTQTKQKPLKKKERELLVRWLKFYDRWLWGMRIRTSEAAALAAADTRMEGITSRRLAILAGKSCEHYCVNKPGFSVRTLLNSKQWWRVMNWVETNREAVIETGSATAAATLAHWKGGGRVSVWAFREALSARGINLPLRSDRPAWSDPTTEAQSTAKPATPKKNLTPVMRQYLEFKDKHPGYVLFFRAGDFYELFLEDAETAASVLGITLTRRVNGNSSIPMAGVPVHAVEGYLRKLIAAGHKAAICDPVEGGEPEVKTREAM